MARARSTGDANTNWLNSVNTFKNQLEIHKSNMEEIKNDFQQIAADLNTLKLRAENCSQGIYVWQSWNLFSRSMAIKTLLDNQEEFDKVREIMQQGLGIPQRDYNGQFDSDFDAENFREFNNISPPDPSNQVELPNPYNNE